MYEFRYLSEEGVWRNTSNPDIHVEIFIAGDNNEPNAAHLATLNEILPHIIALQNKAIWYLAAFTNPEMGTDWHLDALYITSEFPTEFELSLSLSSDIYGDWRVGFYSIKQDYIPDYFSRTQI